MTGDRIWLLSVELAGRTIRCATVPCQPVATVASEAYAAGQAVRHDPTLAVPSVSWRAIPGGDCVGEYGAEIGFYLPSDLSLSALWARGQPINRGVAELSVWYDGTPYEARTVLAKGYIEVDAYALGGEQVTASILAQEPDGTDMLPLSTQIISDATLNPYTVVGAGSIGFSMPDDVDGVYYPIPLGRPGLYIDATGTQVEIPSTPALLITQAAAQERMLIASGMVGSTTMTVFLDNATGLAPTTYAGVVSYIEDGNGAILASVDVSAAAGWKRDGSETYYCTGWTDAITFDNGEHIRGLGDAALYMLRLARSAAVFDLGRWEAARNALNTIAIGGFVGQPVDAWTVITEQLLSVFPRCVVLPGAQGLYPVVFEDVPPDQCVELIEGRDFDLPDGERPQDATDEVYSSIRVEYAFNVAKQNYNGFVVMGPRVDDMDESGHEASMRAYSWSVGADNGPTRETKTIQSAWVWEHDSAARACDEWMRICAERLPSVRLALLDQVTWRSLPIGLALRITSTTLGWDAVPCWVCGASMSSMDEIEVLARPR